MRIAEIIGRVTLARPHPSLKPGTLLVALPVPLEGLRDGADARGEEVVAFDELGAGPGALVGLSEGREAANPFGSDKTPVDAYVACLFDRVDVRKS